MSDYMNLEQKISYYEGITGINQKPAYMNNQQYLDYLIGQSEVKPEPKSKSRVIKKKARK